MNPIESGSAARLLREAVGADAFHVGLFWAGTVGLALVVALLAIEAGRRARAAWRGEPRG